MSKRKKDRLAANNNGGTIRGLAMSSVKSSGLRNFFVVVTIVLSVSLLMVMSLLYTAINTENIRLVADMQHVIYYSLSQQQLKDLAGDERTEYVLGMKEGQGVEIDGKMVRPVAYDSKPLKADGVQISTVTPTAGREPNALNEVMLSDAHCKELGIQAEPGQKVNFTFLNGETEEFIISGIFHIEGVAKMHSLILSQEYAEKGAQLRDVPYEGVVRLQGATKMTRDQFVDELRTIAYDHGIERKHINENNYFSRTLSGGGNQQVEMITILAVGFGVLFASVLVIYSVFYLAVAGRIRQFGQLRTIGMTPKQIGKMVQMEGLILCGIGIPIGLLVGGTVSYFVRPGGWSWMNTGVACVCVVIADIVTVLISIRKPAKIASSISPVEASKFSGIEMSVTGGSNHHKSQASYRKISPIRLACMSSRRSRKKTVLTLVSLGIGGVLYMMAAVFMYSTNLEEYSRQGEYGAGEFIISLSYNIAETEEHGQTSMQVDNPLNQEFIQRIAAIEGVEKVLEFQDVDVLWSAKDERQEQASMSPFARESIEKIETMLDAGSINYDEMLKSDSILIQGNESQEEYYGWKYEVGDQVELSWFDGEREQAKVFRVAGIVDTDKYRTEFIEYGQFIIPEEKLNEMMKGMNLNSKLVIKVDRSKEDRIEKELDTLINEQPMLSMYTLKNRELEDERSFKMTFTLMLGLSIFIVAFSVLNMLNTLITNILTRKHEFAMLQSVGMTKNQLFCMLQVEGLLLVVGNLIITALVGSAAGYGVVRAIQALGVNYMHFHFPTLLYLAYAMFTIIVPVAVSAVMIQKFQKESLVDRLR